MIKAKDIYEQLKQKGRCDGIDNWISELADSFSFNKMQVIVYSSTVSQQGWDGAAFMAEMELRGFHITYECEDRPCGICYYTVTIPLRER